MNKRKANFDSIGRAEERLLGQEVVRPGSPSKLFTEIVEVDQTGRTGPEPVPASHRSPQPDTCAAGEGHVVIPGGPAGHLGVDPSTVAGVGGCCTHPRAPTEPVKVLPSLVEEEDDRAANWFWELLHTAGYEVW